MAEPLKHMYNRDYVHTLSRAIKAYYPPFDSATFEHWLFDEQWSQRPLKARMQRISTGLAQFIDLDYESTLAVLKPVSSQFGGGAQGDYASMFFPEFVAQFGLDYFEPSVDALAHFTRFSSSEFAVRPFIQRHPEQMMAQMRRWAGDNNYFVRRLASEGCRPRLPWAMALPLFKRDPSPIIPILKALQHDPILFVRRSVANNLNDIAKDHPARVLAFANASLGESNDGDWVIKHGLRSLLKQAHPEALALFGFNAVEHIQATDFKVDPSVDFGGQLTFSFTLTSARALGKLRLEYAIDYVKANGQWRRKIFHISETTQRANYKTVSKSVPFKPISTRTYYPGTHQLTIIINGQALASKTFVLRQGSH